MDVRRCRSSLNGLNGLSFIILAAGFALAGCREERPNDPRRFAPVQPNTTSTLGTPFNALPAGRMYQNVPGSDLSNAPRSPAEARHGMNLFGPLNDQDPAARQAENQMFPEKANGPN